MELRENAGGDKNLFSAERKIRKQKMKMEEQRKKQYEREQQRSRCNIFDFINETLSGQRKISRLYFIYNLTCTIFMHNCNFTFFFIFLAEAEEGPSCSKKSSQIAEGRSKMKNMSDKELNVQSYQIGNNISSLEKESKVLKKSLTRHEKYSPAYNNIVQRFNDKQKEIVKLKTSEKNIASEQRNRKNRDKLTIF